jgi:O-antigen/teichoic acid export membrane protein
MSPAIAHVTRVDSVWTPALLGIGLLPLILNGALMGGLLGLHRLGALSCAYLFTGSSRVLAAWGADVLDASLNQSLGLVVLASLATTIFLWWLCRGQAHVGWPHVRPPRLDGMRVLLQSNSSVGVLMALTSVDVVLARYVLSPVESGEYALAATLGRAPLWLTQFLALSMIPALARTGSSGAILRAGALVLATCTLGAGVAAIDPEMWIVLLGGRAYDDAAGVLLPYLVLGTLLALVQVLIVAEMAQGRHLLAKVAWGATFMQVVLCLLFFHGNAFQVLGAAVVAAGGVLLFGVLAFFTGTTRNDSPVRLSVSDGA